MLITFTIKNFDIINLLIMIIYLNDFYSLLVLFFLIVLFRGLISCSSGKV
jgi:hypothetical protein